MNRGNLELIDYAIYYATRAHNGQKRKSDKDVDMIFHPFTVAMLILKSDNEYPSSSHAKALHNITMNITLYFNIDFFVNMCVFAFKE